MGTGQPGVSRALWALARAAGKPGAACPSPCRPGEPGAQALM